MFGVIGTSAAPVDSWELGIASIDLYLFLGNFVWKKDVSNPHLAKLMMNSSEQKLPGFGAGGIGVPRARKKHRKLLQLL
jgi:hypothetical protein